MATDIPVTLNGVTAKENEADEQTLILNAVIGGVSQDIVVDKEWYESKQNP